MGDNTVRTVFVMSAVFGMAVATTGVAQSMLAQTVAADVRPESSKATALVTVDAVNAPLVSVLESIARQAGLRMFLSDKILDPTTHVSLRVRGVAAEEAFAKALAGTSLRAQISLGNVALTRDPSTTPRSVMGTALQGSVSGRVTDATTKQPIRGAVVSMAGVARTVTTTDDGRYRFVNIPPGTYTMSVRALGYVRATSTATVQEGQSVAVDMALHSSASTLDQVVVTGTLVATAQREIPNAMTVITAKDLEQRGITHIDQLFRGDVPGLFVVNQGTWSPLGQVLMFSRGATDIAPTSTPTGMTNPIKTYIDGIEMADPSYLNTIDPRSIERIEIVTGPQASTVYGSNALNGVMQIFTKRGNTSKPQFTATLLTGLVENNFSPSRTPQHDYSAQVSGVEGRFSYNAGGSWVYMGPWSPSMQQTTMSGFGGVRMQAGPISVDGSLRVGQMQNKASGSAAQGYTEWYQNGIFRPSAAAGLTMGGSMISTASPQTLGLTLSYAPLSWWSHEAIVGRDVTNLEGRSHMRGYSSAADTGLAISQAGRVRTSLRYASTARIPLAAQAHAVVSAGVDGWQSLTTSMYTNGLGSLTGTLAGASVSRQPSHNRGMFLQAQLGWDDALFLTYGLRGEWNPNYGDDAQPNLAPRYGIAYTRDVGPVTTKLRASYGRATRPPTVDQKNSVSELQYFPAQAAALAPYYGDFLVQLSNPELEPSYQQGGEGGVELYFGNRGSFTVTRYNQTVDGLIAPPIVDSLRSLVPVPAGYSQAAIDDEGYGYWYQTQNLNVGSIRNQGWELQGTVNVGPLTTRGTYSWTKSRIIGITPRYRPFLTGSQYQTGLPFNFLAEHTWALNVSYGHAATTVSLNINGSGFAYGSDTLSLLSSQFTMARLRNLQPRYSLPDTYRPAAPGYATADLNAAHRFTPWIEGVFQVVNLTDYYRNEYQATYATLGRQMKLGFRIRR